MTWSSPQLLVHWTDGAISAITPDKCVHLASSDTDYEDISEEDYAEADDDDSSWMTADSDFFSDQYVFSYHLSFSVTDTVG